MEKVELEQKVAHIKRVEERFCRELTSLMRKERLGITGELRVFFLEEDDFDRRCCIDDSGFLHF